MSSASKGEPLPHAYTNTVTELGEFVTKTYQGADVRQRQHREEVAIRAMRGFLPVATIVESRPGELVFRKVSGNHGQELLDGGEGAVVMFALGRLLRQLQAITPSFYEEFHGEGVLVHGDFGPNNVLLCDDGSVALLADWEWSTIGNPIDDLAWAEFIVRMHHPGHVSCLPALFDGYGQRPVWAKRKAAMARRAADMEALVTLWHGTPAAASWRYRLNCIAGWHEVP
jgi:hypothetical protein